MDTLVAFRKHGWCWKLLAKMWKTIYQCVPEYFHGTPPVDMVCSSAPSTQKGWNKIRRGLMKAIKVWKIFPTKTKTLQFGKGRETERDWVLKIMNALKMVRLYLAVWLFSQEKNWSACQIRSREASNKRKRKCLLTQCKTKWLQEIPCQGVV